MHYTTGRLMTYKHTNRVGIDLANMRLAALAPITPHTLSSLSPKKHLKHATEKHLTKKCKNHSCRDAFPKKQMKQATTRTAMHSQTTYTMNYRVATNIVLSGSLSYLYSALSCLSLIVCKVFCDSSLPAYFYTGCNTL